jgi:hypothetical protein
LEEIEFDRMKVSKEVSKNVVLSRHSIRIKDYPSFLKEIS